LVQSVDELTILCTCLCPEPVWMWCQEGILLPLPKTKSLSILAEANLEKVY